MDVWLIWAKVPPGDKSKFQEIYKESLFNPTPLAWAKLPDTSSATKAGGNIQATVGNVTVPGNMGGSTITNTVTVGNTTVNTGSASKSAQPWAPLLALAEKMGGRSLITKKSESDPFFYMVIWPK